MSNAGTDSSSDSNSDVVSQSRTSRGRGRAVDPSLKGVRKRSHSVGAGLLKRTNVDPTESTGTPSDYSNSNTKTELEPEQVRGRGRGVSSNCSVDRKRSQSVGARVLKREHDAGDSDHSCLEPQNQNDPVFKVYGHGRNASYEEQRRLASRRAAPSRKVSGSLHGISLRDRMAAYTGKAKQNTPDTTETQDLGMPDVGVNNRSKQSDSPQDDANRSVAVAEKELDVTSKSCKSALDSVPNEIIRRDESPSSPRGGSEG